MVSGGLVRHRKTTRVYQVFCDRTAAGQFDDARRNGALEPLRSVEQFRTELATLEGMTGSRGRW
ncbi:hypothetical protein AArcMg_3148 [Natrarchaeobaculum sulfurireducens]|uniref:Uncharacterized protein n=1 Tax=Natrarchaeobaculum sulfurireducens TaxID=2044521 RepID=A0A346PUD9_9EURY|nr:hypothetical protein AArc1_3056 [Natrarchaeobaculum sulfurireducens]AXR83134.1 hypothetical protein AArcMg_3148 [Natrarchaeobaculum sulfurireducens]